MAAACLLAIPLSLTPLRAQKTDTLKILYPKGQSAVLPSFRDNGKRIDALKARLEEAYKAPTTPKIDRLTVLSTASPEGSTSVNRRVAEGRAQRLATFLQDDLGYPVGEVVTYDGGVDWMTLGDLVVADRKVPSRKDVLQAVDEEDVEKLKEIDNGKAWDYLMEHQFPLLRKSIVTLELSPGVSTSPIPPQVKDPQKVDPDKEQRNDVPDKPEVNQKKEEIPEEEVTPPVQNPALTESPSTTTSPYVIPGEQEQGENGAWSIKTNLLPWALLVANAAVEVDFGNHFSLSVPFYYSGVNWFRSDMKFRVLGTQPEVRYFLRDDFRGLFFALHATFGWYNIALRGSQYRYQDKSMNSPAFGGGVNVGYKLPFALGDRLGVEFTLGAGYLNLDYDKFYNVDNGRLAGSDHKNYFGPDNASVGLYYRFPYYNNRRSAK